MKTIIAGSRSIGDMHLVEKAIRLSGFDITAVVCGGARGVDRLGADWAKAQEGYWEMPQTISVKYFPADWKKHGLKAGPIRNQQMADYADALIAVWDGSSRGTKDMIERAKHAGLVVFVYNLKKVRQNEQQQKRKASPKAGILRSTEG